MQTSGIVRGAIQVEGGRRIQQLDRGDPQVKILREKDVIWCYDVKAK